MFYQRSAKPRKIFRTITGRGASSLTVEEIEKDKELYNLIHDIRIRYSLREDGTIDYNSYGKIPCIYSRYLCNS